MDKLVFPNGGVPLEGDDFLFLQASYAEAFKGLMREFESRTPYGFTLEGLILQGCEVTTTATNFNVSEGYVLIDGEVCYAPAVTGRPIGQLNTSYYRLLVTYDPAGEEVAQNSTIIQTYEKRQAELVNILSPVTYPIVKLANAPYNRFHNIITYKDIVSLYDNNVENTFVNGWGAVDYSLTENLLVTKQFGRVNFRGAIENGSIASAAFTLAAEFRPAANLSFIVPYGTNGIAKVLIAPSGVVTPFSLSAPASGDIIDLSGINYTIE